MSFPRTIRRLVAGVTVAVLLAGCGSTIAGQAVKVGAGGSQAAPPAGPSGPKAGVATADVRVQGDSGSTSDTLAKNTVDDLYDYYGQIFQKDFQRSFTPARQLISYDSKVRGATVCGRSLYHEVNASYNPCADTIVWDRGVLLPDLTEQVGVLAVPTVLSHEMGHLVQDRLDVDTDNVLLLEQQADCYAGAYWRWVSEGHSKYFDLNQTDGIRQVLTAMMSTGDPVGTTPDTEGAHGSGFDRSYAFTLGYSNGAVRCSKITAAEVEARITETGFTVKPTNYGNEEITPDFIDDLATVVDAYFSSIIPGYDKPALTPFQGTTGPPCNGAPTQYPVGYCPATNTVTYNLAELQRIGTPTAGFDSTNGDFSAILLLVSRYGLAAQATTGGSAMGTQAGLRGLCYAGSWASWMRQPQGPKRLTLTPNDLNKAVYEVLASPIPASDAAGSSTTAVIDQVQALYIGVISGAAQCYDFYSS